MNIKDKLGNYSKVAAIVISSTSSANAGMIYTDLYPDIILDSDGENYAIDLNNDNNPDYILTFDSNVTTQTISGTTTNTIGKVSVGIQNLQQSNFWAASLFYAYDLNENESVSSGQPWVGNWSNYINGLKNIVSYSFWVGQARGYWMNSNEKYLGVKFNISGNTHYGWVRMSVSNSIVTIHDYAYESVPNVGIITGNIPTLKKIDGKVYSDENNNCSKEISERSLPFIVKAGDIYTTANDSGYFELPLRDSVNYTLYPIVSSKYQGLVNSVCPTDYSIFIDNTWQGDSSGFDFGFDIEACPLLTVDVSSNRRRRCAQNYTYVNYSNDGFADTTGVKVTVELPQYVDFVSANYPHNVNSAGKFVFDIDTLRAGESGQIKIIDSVYCIPDITGLTQCTKAWITPINNCLTDTIWDGSDLKLESECILNTNSVHVKVKNEGTIMQDSVSFRLYNNTMLVYEQNLMLGANDSLWFQFVKLPGTTVRIEVDQSLGHPIYQTLYADIEACSVTDSITHGFTDQLPQFDESIQYEEDCLPIVDSFDPNDKRVSPTGITANRYVKPQTLLNYTIRFQNTGTAPAYKVVVVDTLDASLDISTFQLESSSHDYELEVSGIVGIPILTITFNNINLLDSITDELNSHGFIKYKIAPYDTIPDNTIIHNKADIYFDFNTAITTNDAWVNIYDTTLIGMPIDIIDCDTTISPSLFFNTQDTTICFGDSIQFLVGGADNFSWIGSFINNAFINNPIVKPQVSEVYYVQGYNSISCTSALDSIYVEVYDTIPTAEFSYQLIGFEVSLLDSSSNDVNSWHWNIDNDSISIGDSAQYLFTQDGTYEMCLIASNDCFSDTICKQVTITGVGINEIQSQSNVVVYPNPVTNQLTIELKDSDKQITSVQLIDVNGRVVVLRQNQYDITDKLVFDVSQLPKGIYIYEILSDDEILGIGEIVKK